MHNDDIINYSLALAVIINLFIYLKNFSISSLGRQPKSSLIHVLIYIPNIRYKK
jgi:hypothetical protein